MFRGRRHVLVALAVTLTACNHASTSSTTSTEPITTTTVPTTTSTTRTDAFVSSVEAVTAADLPSSWRPGCPVAPDALRRLRLTFWGFDDQPHTGALIVNASVATAVTQVFARLYARRFPIRRMEPVDAYGGSDEASLDADNTAGFNCRYAVAAGPKHWSVHAYGKAIDVNPVENPYIDRGVIHPASGAAFVRRTPVRPGMAYPGGDLNAAFGSIGWGWGGRWSSPDYQHFSATGT